VSTRVEILKSAAVAFRRLGYHGATVEKIAALLHMKKGNLYYYFHNKEEILFACHQYSLDRLLAQLEEVEQSGLAPDEKLRQLIGFFVHTILDELHGTALFLPGSPENRHRAPRPFRPGHTAHPRGGDPDGAVRPR
jgi:AcrR family transcriptional regulator